MLALILRRRRCWCISADPAVREPAGAEPDAPSRARRRTRSAAAPSRRCSGAAPSPPAASCRCAAARRPVRIARRPMVTLAAALLALAGSCRVGIHLGRGRARACRSSSIAHAIRSVTSAASDRTSSDRIPTRPSGTTTSTSSRRAGRRRTGGNYWIIPSICFNCESACGILAYVDKETADRPQDRRQPAPSRQPRPHLREGRRHAEPARGSGSHPLSAAARRRARRSGKWEQVSWDEALDRHRRAHPQGDRRGPAARADVSRRPAGRGRLRQPRAAGVGRRRPQQPHQRLLVVGAARALPLDAATIGRRPTTPTRRRSCCCRRTSRPATTSTRTRSGSSKAQAERRDADRHRSAAVEHVGEGRLWLPAYSGTEGALLLAMVRDPARRGAATTASSCARWVELARTTCAPSGPTSPVTFDSFIAALKELYAQFTPEFAAEETGVAAERIVEAARAIGARRRPLHARTAGAPRPPAICGAGRSRAASTCSSCSPAAVGTVGGVEPARRRTSSSRSIRTRRRRRTTGTSCSSRASSRSRSSR